MHYTPSPCNRIFTFFLRCDRSRLVSPLRLYVLIYCLSFGCVAVAHCCRCRAVWIRKCFSSSVYYVCVALHMKFSCVFFPASCRLTIRSASFNGIMQFIMHTNLRICLICRPFLRFEFRERFFSQLRRPRIVSISVTKQFFWLALRPPVLPTLSRALEAMLKPLRGPDGIIAFLRIVSRLHWHNVRHGCIARREKDFPNPFHYYYVDGKTPFMFISLVYA